MNPKNVSPKVWAQAVVTVVLGTLVAALGAVTPGMLGFLGPWAPVALAGVTAAGGLLSGYVVNDPVRDVGSQALKFQQSIVNPPIAYAAPAATFTTVPEASPVVVPAPPATPPTIPAQNEDARPR